MSERQLPWYVQRPYDGCNGKPMQYSVWDADGNFVCECDGDEQGYNEAIAICIAINRAGDRICADGGEPATCFGSYEDELHPAYACDKCCGHGNEDGHCEQLAAYEGTCRACNVESELGTEEVPRPVDARVHTCAPANVVPMPMTWADAYRLTASAIGVDPEEFGRWVAEAHAMPLDEGERHLADAMFAATRKKMMREDSPPARRNRGAPQ